MRRTALLASLACLAACAPESDLRARVEAAEVFSPRRLETGDDEIVALGQLLFFDRELSGNRDVACSTCHLPSLHAGDGRSISMGHDGERLARGSIEPFNRSRATALFWDGRLELRDGRIVSPEPVPDGIETLLEAQALLPLLNRDEMRGQPGDVAVDLRANELAVLGDDAPFEIWAAIMTRVLALEGYRDAFARAFPDVPPDALTIAHVAIAIAAFEERIWELTDTAFDDWLGSVSEPGDDVALDDAQRRGADLFFGSAGCADCHGGPLLSDQRFHNIAVPQIGRGLDEAGLDEGRFRVTGDPLDRFAFRTPSLRNVALTAPYMHDGAYLTLEEVVLHHLDPVGSLERYSGLELPADLEVHREPATISAIIATLDPAISQESSMGPTDVADLVAFLSSLTSRTELVVVPEAGIPRSVPSGLPIDAYPELLER